MSGDAIVLDATIVDSEQLAFLNEGSTVLEFIFKKAEIAPLKLPE